MNDFLAIFQQFKIPNDYDTTTLLMGVVSSVGIAILRGLEREFSQKREEKEGDMAKLFAGIRTYPLITLLGYLMMFLSGLINIWIFIVTLAGILAYLGI